MLSTAVLQELIDKMSYSHWQYESILPQLTSGTDFWGKIKDEPIAVVEALIEGAANTDVYISGTSRVEKYVFNDLVSSLETHARESGYDSLDDLTSGLVCQGNLEVDEGFKYVYEATRVGRSPSTLTPGTWVISGTRLLLVT